MVFDEEAAADMGFDRRSATSAAEAPARLWEQDPEPIPEVARPSKERDTAAIRSPCEPETMPYAPTIPCREPSGRVRRCCRSPSR